jgi:uncharacterized membrane protein YoaK (UPF0700 family)
LLGHIVPVFDINLTMLRHTGHKRATSHNIKLAIMLCLTAGFVNGAGFLAFAVLTTNVTGHVAIFAERLAIGDFYHARIVGLWMLLFWLGAFVSSLLINKAGKNQRYSFALPIVIEIAILTFVGITGYNFDKSIIKTEIFAGSLLFAMGLQNAMVSVISGSVVRTTHLTGTFTDLGIEMAHLFKKLNLTERGMYIARIKIRLTIILFFTIGCISAAIMYKWLQYKTFFVPVAILVITLLFDVMRVRVMMVYRRVTRKQVP